MQSRIICSIEIHNCYKWLDCKIGMKLRIACFYSIPYICKMVQPDTLQHNGMTNSEIEICMWK